MATTVQPGIPRPVVGADRDIYIRDIEPIFGYSENAMPDMIFDHRRGA
jgi:hypothetical protein